MPLDPIRRSIFKIHFKELKFCKLFDILIKLNFTEFFRIGNWNKPYGMPLI